LNNFDKTDWEYSPTPTDDLIRFWRSQVKRSRSQQACVGEGVHITLRYRSPCSGLLTLWIRWLFCW